MIGEQGKWKEMELFAAAKGMRERKIMISAIKHMLEHHSLLRNLVPLCRKLGVVHLLHIVKGSFERQRNVQKREEFQNFCRLHKKEFQKLYDMLEDDFSKKTLRRVIEYRITGRTKALRGVVTKPQYFPADIMKPAENEVFIDGGAYVGDTAEDFIKHFVNRSGDKSSYRKIYEWEPDEMNIRQMKKNLSRYHDIAVVPYGMWKKKTEIGFLQNGNAGSKIAKDGRRKVCVDSIDHLHMSEKVTFIKMDIEGSEKEALLGAERVIKRDKPKLAICIYHAPEDLYEIPFLIKSMVPEYRLYIRHHSDTFAETVVYAVVG